MGDAGWLIEPAKAPEPVEIDLFTRIETADVVGDVNSIEAATGLWIFLADLKVDADCTLEASGELSGAWVDFQFFLNGKAVFETTDGVSGEVSPASGLAVRMIERRGRYHFSAGMRVRTVGVGVSRERLATIVGTDASEALEPLHRPLLDRSLAWPFPVTPSLRRIGQNLFDPMPGGRLRLLFLECAAVQVTTIALSGLSSDRAISGNTRRISAREVACVSAARDMLLSDLRTPASLDQLAAEVGLGPRQLLRGFRTVYGQSPFELVRNERLDHAKVVLAETDIPLKEIAYRVGYADVTNFIHAFRRRFGAPPRQFLRSDADGA
jgi:AraC-like DNA-binding protein